MQSKGLERSPSHQSLNTISPNTSSALGHSAGSVFDEVRPVLSSGQLDSSKTYATASVVLFDDKLQGFTAASDLRLL